MDYQEAAHKAFDHLRSYRMDPTGWRSCKHSNELSISWRPSTEFHGNLYKAEGIIPAKPADVLKYVKPDSGLRKKWDPNVEELKIIDTINENTFIVRTTTSSAFMNIISAREFIDVVQAKEDEDGSVVCLVTNVEHPLCQPCPKYVRGFNYSSGCFCIPVPGDPRKTQILSFFQSDPGGSLPRIVVESFFPSNISALYDNLCKAVVKLAA